MEQSKEQWEQWFGQVLKNKNIVDQLLTSQNEDTILAPFNEQQIEEIKICADMLSHKDEKYSQVAEMVHQYQIRVGYLPDFSKKH